MNNGQFEYLSWWKNAQSYRYQEEQREKARQQFEHYFKKPEGHGKVEDGEGERFKIKTNKGEYSSTKETVEGKEEEKSGSCGINSIEKDEENAGSDSYFGRRRNSESGTDSERMGRSPIHSVFTRCISGFSGGDEQIEPVSGGGRDFGDIGKEGSERLVQPNESGRDGEYELQGGRFGDGGKFIREQRIRSAKRYRSGEFIDSTKSNESRDTRHTDSINREPEEEGLQINGEKLISNLSEVYNLH